MASTTSSTTQSATTKFQLALPYALYPISPGLAALHAARAQRSHDVDISYRTPRCSRCGASFFEGAGTIRTVRKPRSKRRKNIVAPSHPVTRVLRYSCIACGYDDDIAIDSDNANVPSMPQARKMKGVFKRVAHASSSLSATPYRVAEKSEAHNGPSPIQSTIHQKSPLPSLSSPSSRSTSIEKQPSTLKSSNPADPAISSGAVRAKPRPKAKSGLQALLAKNRERQGQSRDSDGSGLSAFLQGL